MLGALLVLVLLPGLTVLDSCVTFLLFWALCTGQRTLGILGTMVSFTWRCGFLFEQWSGHCLLFEKVTRPHVRAHRPVSISSVPVSEGIEIRQGVVFFRGLIRALGKLPGALVGFVMCYWWHLSRLRHLVWELCSRGLTSRPLESCHYQCLKTVCGVLAYPSGAAAELLDGSLKLRYCTTQFSRRLQPGVFPGWVCFCWKYSWSSGQGVL